MKIYKGQVTKLEPNQIFVFGSNTQGRHGKGAAKIAHDLFGAVYGISRGFTGNCYAICTKDLTKKVHPSVSEQDIVYQICKLYQEAKLHSEKEFLIPYDTQNSNLNGFSSEEMAKMFKKAGEIPENIIFKEDFAHLLNCLMV